MTQPITQLPRARVITGAAAEQELHAMSLIPSNLTRSCVEGLQSAVISHSSFEPVIAFGISIWSKIVGALRKQLNEEDWKHHDIANAPRSVSPDGSMAIAAVGGDSQTAHANGNPRNARLKGPRFANEIESNAAKSSAPRYTQCRLNLGPGDEDTVFANLQTWVLLYFWDRASNELRLELSLPIECDKGFVTQWETRIILPAQDLSGYTELTSGERHAVLCSHTGRGLRDHRYLMTLEASRVTLARQRAGLSKSALAHKTGTTPRTVTTWESTGPPSSRLLQIATITGMPPEFFSTKEIDLLEEKQLFFRARRRSPSVLLRRSTAFGALGSSSTGLFPNILGHLPSACSIPSFATHLKRRPWLCV